MKTLFLSLMAAGACTAFAQTSFTQFEARHVHPIGLTPDSAKLLVLNSPDARLSIFDPSSATPSLVAEIPVGLGPVSVRARTNDEAWVVNEVSDTVTVVSLSTNSVIATLRVNDEPADVVFASGKAFVSCARAVLVRVFDAASRVDLGSITLTGVYPRALAANADGTKVYATFQLSGNHTTVLSKETAPVPPIPTNASLPPAPKTALIVDAGDARVKSTVLDHDVAEIDAAAQTVTRYLSGAGTCLFGAAIRPGTDELWIPNTEALNLVRFEPVLNGHFADNRLTRITLSTNAVSVFDLNSGIDYGVLPNPSAQATALAQPTNIGFSADGVTAWVAAFGSDRIAKVDAATGMVLARADVRTGSTSAKNMRGPRGLALNETTSRLYVLNKLSNTVSVINTDTLAVTAEVATGTHEQTPLAIKEGRGFLFDARLSGNGTVSCATCHLDADRDGIAWDLGNPGGEMATAMGANLVVHDTKTRSRIIHPMKGPMTTQTLLGLKSSEPFHWRGDKPTLQSFNPTFENLMGGEQQTSEDMDLFAEYIFSLALHPNPNRNLDRTLPATFQGGAPPRGRDLFVLHSNHCEMCHGLPRGSDNNIDLPQEVGSSQPLKNPSLRNVYQRLQFDPRPGHTSVSGYGLLHDGTGFSLPTVHPYVLDALTTPADFADVIAFVLCFDSGTGLTVGYGPTVTASNKSATAVLADLALLEARDTAGDCDLIVRGTVGGVPHSLLYTGTATGYRFDSMASGSVSRTALLALVTGADSLSFMGVLPGTGSALSIDHDGDGVLDGDEVAGSPVIVRQPRDAASATGGSVTFTVEAKGSGLHYQWRKGTSAVGSDAASYTVSPAVAGSYNVVVTNTLGTATSGSATLTITTAPVITAHPLPKTVAPGATASLSVTATGTGLSYRWTKNGNPVIGATASTLELNDAQNVDSGSYAVIVSNGAGSVTSHAAQLDVPVPPVVAPLALLDARVGETYSKQVTATNHPTKFNIGGLPLGLTFDATSGLISGHPTTPGPATITVTATNAAGPSVQVSDTMEVFDLAAGTVGSYQGVVERQAALNDDLGGRITVTTTATGTFTGSLVLGLKTYPLSGPLNPSGTSIDSTVSVTINRSGLPSLIVSFTVTPGSRSLGGNVSNGSVSAAFTARQPVIGPAAYAGNYTFAMLLKAADVGNDAVPQGHSIGAFKVSTAGVATGLFKLADATSVTFTASLEEGGSLSLFKPLYTNTGSLLGTLNLDSANGYRMAASQMGWTRKAQAAKSTTRSYKAGFAALNLDVHGGRYVIPMPGAITMGLGAGPGNARMAFAGGAAPSPATRLDLNTIELVAGSPVIGRIVAPNPGIVTLTVTPGSGSTFTAGTTGSFSGSFMLLDPDTTVVPNKPVTRTAVLTGMIVNDGLTVKGYGFFQLPELPALVPVKTTISTSRILSGSALLEPAL